QHDGHGKECRAVSGGIAPQRRAAGLALRADLQIAVKQAPIAATGTFAQQPPGDRHLAFALFHAGLSPWIPFAFIDVTPNRRIWVREIATWDSELPGQLPTYLACSIERKSHEGTYRMVSRGAGGADYRSLSGGRLLIP